MSSNLSHHGWSGRTAAWPLPSVGVSRLVLASSATLFFLAGGTVRTARAEDAVLAGATILVPVAGAAAPLPIEPVEGLFANAAVSPTDQAARVPAASSRRGLHPLLRLASGTDSMGVGLLFTPRAVDAREPSIDIPPLPSQELLGFDARRSPAGAFTRELRRKSLRYTDTGLWANAADEIHDDDFVAESRSSAARYVLSQAVEAAVGVALETVGRRSKDGGEGKVVAGDRNFGFRVDSTPGFTWRRVGPVNTLRLDIPLTGQGVRFRTVREFAGHDKGVKRLATGVTLDPLDESIRFGISLGF